MKSSRAHDPFLLPPSENSENRRTNPTTSALGYSAISDNDAISSVNPYKKLQAAKRLDWRFFLPNPQLQQVAYWGPSKDDLKEALTAVAQEVVALPMQQDDDPLDGTTTATVKYTLIVLKDPTAAIIQRAIARLEENGALYIETQSALWPQRWLKRNFVRQVRNWGLLSQPKDYRDLLEGQGMTDVQVLWMWPSFRNTRKIIPLDTPGIFAYLFDAESQGTRSYQWLFNLLYRELVIKRQWFGWLIPSFGIIAMAPTGTGFE